MKRSRLFILSLCLVTLFSCGKKAQEIQDEAILKAQYLLSSKSCDEAISVLEAIPYAHFDARYLKTLASGYACKANYSTIRFFADDIDNTVSPSPIGGMTTYSTSLAAPTQSILTDAGFKNIVKAVDILLYAGNLNHDEDPSVALRAQHFSARVLADMHNQITFMMMVELGRYMKIYANTNAAGFKGQGTLTNTCFTEYTLSDPLTQGYIISGANTGSCSSLSGSSHPDLVTGAINRKEVMCRGVTLMNSVIELLPEVIAGSGGGQTTTLANFIADILAIRNSTIGIGIDIGEAMAVTSYKRCVSDADINFTRLENTFAAYFESMVH